MFFALELCRKLGSDFATAGRDGERQPAVLEATRHDVPQEDRSRLLIRAPAHLRPRRCIHCLLADILTRRARMLSVYGV